jgi:N-methylhydantoinase A/oxoprolinase/acetone carboxylase beta subunit
MIRVGIDIGGTFTDLILWDDQDGRLFVHKLPSTPADPALAAIDGLKAICAKAGASVADIALLFHGTTVATNIIIERNGASVGLITTKGFRDVLHIGRKKRRYNFSNYQDVPRQSRPIVRRRDRMAVAERVLAPDGRIATKLDLDEARAAIRTLKSRGLEAISVCFLFSFLNPQHEQAVRDLIEAEYPEAFVSVSHQVAPLFREYERFSTTALNAYVGPKTARYVDRFAQAARSAGLKGEVHLMTSAGGAVTARGAKEKPVSLLLSGPVAGLIAGIRVGESAGDRNVISLDVGGTSADIGVAPDGAMRMRHLLDTQIGDFDAMIPMVDMETIGAGGGSLASVDAAGMFRVGPESAGAVPGPACYGRGGTRAAVTDALVVLGWLRPEALARSAVKIDPDAAHAAVRTHVAEKLGIDVPQAALGMLRIVTQNMIDSIALQSTAKGYDVREFALIGLGGAGPLFAGAIATQMGMKRAIVPPHPGVGAAAGLLGTDLRYDLAGTCWQNLAAPDRAKIAALYESLEQRVRSELRADGFGDDKIAAPRRAECRYDGQGYELTVEAPPGAIDDAWIATVTERFHAAHERAYLRRFADKTVLLINVGVTGLGRLPALTPRRAATSGSLDAAVLGRRQAWFAGANGAAGAQRETTLYERARLAAGHAIAGPAIIEQDDCTTVIPPGMAARVDAVGNLILETRS